MRKLICSLLLIAPGMLDARAQSPSAQEIAKRAFGSTVLLVMEDANGQPLSLGSGFFVRDGEIASNLHVVEGLGEEDVKPAAAVNKDPVKFDRPDDRV